MHITSSTTTVHITARQSALFLIGFQIAASGLLVLILAITGSYPEFIPLTAISCLVYLALFVAYKRGWEGARYVLVGMVTLATLMGTQEPFLTKQASLTIFIPPVLAAILLSPRWVVATTLLVLGGLVIRAGGQGTYADPITLVLVTMIVGGVVLARLISDSNERAMREQTHLLELARQESEAAVLARDAQLVVAERSQQVAEVARAELDAQLRTIEQQQSIIREMSVPVLPVAANTLVLPLIGVLDSARLELVRQQALEALERSGAARLLLDITGVPIVDSQVAQGLLDVVQAARLLGASAALIGVRPEVAQAMVALGVDRLPFHTYRDLQTALAAT